jgi:hypothetical protein
MDFQKKAKFYYLRKDIQNILLGISKSREVVPKYMEGFGKRPDTVEYANDIKNLAEKGATSFHCSEELWKNPLDLKTELSSEEMNEMRMGWDLLIDIDSSYLDYSKIAAELIIDALKFHNVQNVGLKYSGNKGFHIVVPWKAFPEEINGIKTAKLFPEVPRAIAGYLNSFIREKLINEISSKTQPSKYIRGEEKAGDFAEKVMPDIILVSPRHLFRMPYSLNEKSGLSSVVIRPDQLKNFHPGWARPDRVYVKNFIPDAEKNEAKELLIQALDWKKNFKPKFSLEGKKEFIVKDASPEFYPPCIKYVLAGLKHDGRKRALFILMNFFKSISLGSEEIKQKIEEWNKLNYKPLKQGYISAQLSWFAKSRIMLPPNCDKVYYKDIAVCNPDNFCSKINNPVKYVSGKLRLQSQMPGKRKKKESGK